MAEQQNTPPVRMEMDAYGNHRIVAHGIVGEWRTYENISTLGTPEGWLIGATKYYNGILPTECVLSIKKVFDGGAAMVIVPGCRPT